MELKEDVVVADRFRLVRMIGRGGMGSVWQAVHIALEQPCAVKFIEGDLGNVADAHARFEREAKAAAHLRSPHVVQIIDHGVWGGRPYIAMELLEGEDLGKALREGGGKLPPAVVYNVVNQVCRALTKAHQAGIVHRDLKPDNIFIINDDDRQLVKILDFGVAKQTSQAIDGSNTKTGAMLGTPYYMSPEQAQGIKSVDARSDLWSLAVIVYQCITGRLPFESEALGDLLVKIIVNPVPRPSTVAPVPPGFDAWWAKAAERAPENRYPTAKDFSSALAVALGISAMTDPGRMAPFGTAVMQQAQQAPTYLTPQQQSFQPAHTANLQTTPHPSAVGPPLGTPPPGYQGGPPLLSASGTPATFSGVEPPITLPVRKGPPIGIILGVFGAMAAIGIVITAISLTKPSGTRTTASSAALSAAATTSVASAEPSAEPTTTATQAASAAEPEPPPSATAAATTATVATATPRPIVGGGGGAAKVTPPTPTPTTPPKPSAVAAPSASTKKWNAGF